MAWARVPQGVTAGCWHRWHLGQWGQGRCDAWAQPILNISGSFQPLVFHMCPSHDGQEDAGEAVCLLPKLRAELWIRHWTHISSDSTSPEVTVTGRGEVCSALSQADVHASLICLSQENRDQHPPQPHSTLFVHGSTDFVYCSDYSFPLSKIWAVYLK